MVEWVVGLLSGLMVMYLYVSYLTVSDVGFSRWVAGWVACRRRHVWLRLYHSLHQIPGVAGCFILFIILFHHFTVVHDILFHCFILFFFFGRV